ncbi:MAG: branched-chain amino acid ABC transporter permease [Bosea sp.]|uniref:ABC transporter permease subunit n=1 Tax=Bosea sp. (in: a-proteobacteria) TaxID=1871050 RepID=UPI0010F9771C|nr:branched-chain amino acid ABC transporter permease [Bosea sp. (in: a-proteobacteria)]MCP4734848.1 branched-chain amino acid ABC transporter permease [Bosea sp. (in: a-proteobacteria)]
MIAYIVNLATLVAIFGIAAASMNLLIGYAGIFSLAHGAFFGIGAFAAAQLALNLTPDLLLAFLAAASLSIALSLCLALPALRVRGEYFIAASLGLQMFAVTVFHEAPSLTGGHGGLAGIPQATLLGIEVGTPWRFLAVAAVTLVLSLLLIQILMRGSFGRALMAMRDAESAAMAFGKNIPLLKTLAVAAGCGLVGIAGALYAFHISFVIGDSFTLEQSVLLQAMVIIGGAGTLAGPLVGTLLILLLPAALTFMPMIPPTEIGTVQQFLYGAAMTLLMIFRPGGIAGQSVGRR